MSFNVKIHLSLGRAVILNGYWLDQMSFAFIQSFNGMDLPPLDSPVFTSPKELFQPDLIIYLNLPDDLFYTPFTTRSPRNWKKRALTLYEGLQTRYPIVVQDLKGVFRVTTDAVYQHIFERLAGHRDVSARNQRVSFDYSNH
ncbi:uncharacterized protein LOC124352772 isoform X2 [Homalodisca vitripennis]|nr:uncharacterized protein LOC124352772 isoform X2 [Homalodisca vitripennis]